MCVWLTQEARPQQTPRVGRGIPFGETQVGIYGTPEEALQQLGYGIKISGFGFPDPHKYVERESRNKGRSSELLSTEGSEAALRQEVGQLEASILKRRLNFGLGALHLEEKPYM